MSEHVDDGTWEALALGELPADARAGHLRHIAACATCSRIWIGLRALEVDAAAIDPAVVRTPAGLDDVAKPGPAIDDVGARRRRRLGSGLVIGGGVALAVAAAMLLWLRPGREAVNPGGDVVRGDGAATIEVAAPRGNAGARFEWTAVASATSYRVTVWELEGKPIWGPTTVTASPLDLPRLAAGGYRWRVEALRDGAVIARSPLVAFSVAP